MSTLEVMVLVVCVFAFVAIIGVLSYEAMKGRKASRKLELYRQTCLSKQGWSKGYGNYDLRSFDGGQHWFNVVRTDGGGIVVTGPAEPELLRHLDGMDALTNHVWKHGSLDLSQPGDVRLLEGAGFTVERRDTAEA